MKQDFQYIAIKVEYLIFQYFTQCDLRQNYFPQGKVFTLRKYSQREFMSSEISWQ